MDLFVVSDKWLCNVTFFNKEQKKKESVYKIENHNHQSVFRLTRGQNLPKQSKANPESQIRVSFYSFERLQHLNRRNFSSHIAASSHTFLPLSYRHSYWIANDKESPISIQFIPVVKLFQSWVSHLLHVASISQTRAPRSNTNQFNIWMKLKRTHLPFMKHSTESAWFE